MAKTPPKLGVSELVRRVGDDNIQFQVLQGSISNISLVKGGKDVKVTFFTSPSFINPGNVVRDEHSHIGLLLWLPKPQFDEAMKAVQS